MEFLCFFGFFDVDIDAIRGMAIVSRPIISECSKLNCIIMLPDRFPFREWSSFVFLYAAACGVYDSQLVLAAA